MRFLFYMGHPAHFHNVSIVLQELEAKGHEILLVIREKDVLLDLTHNLPYNKVILPPRKGNSKWSLVTTILNRNLKMLGIARKFKPDLLIGTDIAITHVGRLLKIPSVVLNEDDLDAIPYFTQFGIRFATTHLCPVSLPYSKYADKTITYPGFHELAYLHPDHFQPDRSKIESLYNGKDRYYLLRFSALSAHHDHNVNGISDELALKIVHHLKNKGEVYITSERPLSPDLEPYRINIHPSDIHHALFFATLYIGDSQTMAAEAAVLGTPAIRYNDFAGKLGYLEELEHRYGLTKGIPISNIENLMDVIMAWSSNENIKEEWKKKRLAMLKERINVAELWSWFLINYPKSQEQVDNYISDHLKK